MRTGFGQIDGPALAIGTARSDLRRTSLHARPRNLRTPEVAPFLASRLAGTRRFAMRLGSSAVCRTRRYGRSGVGFAMGRVGGLRAHISAAGSEFLRGLGGHWRCFDTMRRRLTFNKRSFDLSFLTGCGRADFGRRGYGGLRFRHVGRWFDARWKNRGIDLRLRAIIHEGRNECLFLSCILCFEVKWLRRFTCRGGRAFRVTPAHHGRIEPLLEDRAGAGLDHGLLAQQRIAMNDLIEIGLDLIGLVGTEQAGVAMRMGELQPIATGDDILNGYAPFFGQTFDSLSGHLSYFIQPSSSYPVQSRS